MDLKGMTSFLCAILSSLVISSQASAFVFAPAFNYNSQKEDSVKESSYTLDLRFGTMIGDPWYIGGIYDIQKENSGGLDTDTWGLGPSVGLIYPNLSFIISYYLVSERQTPGVKFDKALGPQIDVGYSFPIGGSVKFGPQLTWRDVRYNNPAVKKVSSFKPYLAFYFSW